MTLTMESAPEAPITPGEDPGTPAEGGDEEVGLPGGGEEGGSEAPAEGDQPGGGTPGEEGDEAPTG